MLLRTIITICIIIAHCYSYAQKQYNIWAFGESSGLNFNTVPVSAFRSATEAKLEELPYYTSSICDKEGNLLFYTDGFNFWNRDNFILPKYKNWSCWSPKVMPLICPYPENDSLFYVFGVGDGINPYDLNYITTMMHKSGDIEEVVWPRPVDPHTFYTKLLSNTSLALTGTSHCNQRDYWIIAYAENAFYSFLVTPSGVDPNPVISPVKLPVISGRPGTHSLILGLHKSNIKISANGERLIVPLPSNDEVAVFRFNNLTGSISDLMELRLPLGNGVEDAELSPDGTKLYIAGFGPDADVPEVTGHNIFQLDLNAGNKAQIESTALQINEVPDRETCTPHVCFLIYRVMQLAPDGRIYVGMRYADQKNIKVDMLISVIEDPNKAGIYCRFKKNEVDLGKKYMFLGYNYIRSGSFKLKENGIQIQQRNCSDKPVVFSLLFNNVDSVKWDFGDPSSGNLNFSISLTPEHQYPAPGTYTVHALIYKNCLADTATKTVVIEPNPSVHVPAFIKDTVVCVGDQLSLDVKTAQSKQYEWENGLIYSNRIIKESGRYRVTVMNDCSIDQKEFTVEFKECPCSVFIPTAFTPDNDGLNDVFKPVFKCVAKNYKLRIYHRYGGVVFETSQLNLGWNGKRGDLDLPSGVYVWLMEYINPNTKKTILKKGTVALIR